MLVSKIGDIEAAIFDLDETLIDAQSGLTAAHKKVADLFEKFFTESKLTVELSKIEDTIRQLDDEMNQRLLYNRNVWWQMLVDQLAPIRRLPTSLIRKMTTEYWNAYEEDSVPYPDAATTLEYLKDEGYKLGLVTDDDGTVGRKARRISRLPLKDFFDTYVVSGDETAEKKTSPLPFLLVADRLEVSPRKCVMIGDKPFTDIEGARKAGMQTILVVRRRWNTSIQADHEVTCLSELRTLL